jgi:radical SAM enzyme (TIGR01210 family)
MCDLWRYTLDESTRVGDLPAQIRHGLCVQPSASPPSWIKLYNASNFFDPKAVPVEDLPSIADLCRSFQRVIVENHPKLLHRNILEFRDRLAGRLEIAMGLETIEPVSFQLLRKEFEWSDFEHANAKLADWDVDRRVFVMLQPPGTNPSESVDWVLKTLRFAEQCGVRHASIIPTRGGNGMMEQLQRDGMYVPPQLWQLELCIEESLTQMKSMLVTVDLWDTQRVLGSCERCVAVRTKRLLEMNLTQTISPPLRWECPCPRGPS